jgi:hypothetical protein
MNTEEKSACVYVTIIFLAILFAQDVFAKKSIILSFFSDTNSIVRTVR